MLTENSYNEFMDNFVEVFEEGDDFMDFDDNGFDDDELLNGNFSLEDEEDDFSDEEENDFSDEEENDFSDEEESDED